MIADAHNRRRPNREGWALFEAEAAYADSIFRSAIGDTEGCIRALERAVEISPGYAPAVIATVPGEQELWRVVNSAADTILNLQYIVNGTPLRDASGTVPPISSHARWPSLGSDCIEGKQPYGSFLTICTAIWK